jgi:transposase-like protein
MDMPRKKQTVASQAAARGPLPELPAGVLDELIKGPMSPEQAQDLMLALNKAVIERIMGAEMNAHLGYQPGTPKLPEQSNERNVSSGKTVLTERGAVRIDVPRDRDGSFESILIPKHERCFRGFDERIITMHVHGGCLRTRRWRTGSHFVRSSSVKSSKPRMPREKIWRFEQI